MFCIIQGPVNKLVLIIAMVVILCSARELQEDQSVTVLHRLPELNRFTFHNSVLRDWGHDYDIKDWVVVFCPRWFQPCQFMKPNVEKIGNEYEAKANSALLSSVLRFAYVDCATEKALCNEQGVEDYPWVVHYHKNKQVASWTTDREKDSMLRLSKWLDKELEHTLDAPVLQDLDAQNGGIPNARSTFMSFLPQDADSRSAAADWSVIIAIIAGNAWLISSNLDRRPKKEQLLSSSPTHVSDEIVGAPTVDSPPAAVPIARCLMEELMHQQGTIEL